MNTIIAGGIIVLLVVLLGLFITTRIRTVPPSEALIVSGASKDGKVKVVPPGGRTFVIPVLQTARALLLGQQNIPLTVEGLDANSVGVDVSGVAIIKVGSDENSIRQAGERYLDKKNPDDTIRVNAQNTLTGTLRAIVSQLTISDLISKREELQQKVLDSAVPELEKMGLVIDSFQISDINDKTGYIKALGIPEAARVEKDARIAKAKNEEEANNAEVAARQKIAERQRDLAIRSAELKAETDRAQAEADSAGPIAAASKARDIATTKQATAEAEAVLRERQLDIEIRRPADAQLYQAEKKAAAEAVRTKLTSQAAANARRISAEAEASAIENTGKAEAKVTEAKGLAEAISMQKQAEAYKAYNEAAKLALIIERLPEIAKNLSDPISKVSRLDVISTDGASALPKMAINNFEQLSRMVEHSTGFNLKSLFNEDLDSTTTTDEDYPVAVEDNPVVDADVDSVEEEEEE